MMKKHMQKLIICFVFACAFVSFAGCGGTGDDSGAYEAAAAAYESGNYDLALEEFQKAADNDGRTAEAYRGIGLIYLQQENYEFAVSMFDISLSEMKHEYKEFSDDVLMYKAEALTKASRTDEALEIYDGLKDGSRAAEAYALEGGIYLNTGDLSMAASCFENAVAVEEDISVCLLIYEAYASVNLEGYGADYLETALQTEPETREDYAMLGMAYNYLGDYNNACTYLNTAIDMGYDDAAAMLGNVYFEAGDISSAKQLFNSEISAGRSIAMAYNGLALCAIEDEDYESALVYIDLGLKCGDDSAEKSLLFNEVVAYEKMLDFETALQKAQSYMEKYPADKEMENELRFLSHS